MWSDVEHDMVRMGLWRWPSAILARKSSPWLTVARVSADHAPTPAIEEAGCIDLPIELSRRDFQDTLPLVFQVGGNLDAEAPEA